MQGSQKTLALDILVSVLRKTHTILDIVMKGLTKKVYYCPDLKLMPVYLCYLYNLSFEELVAKWISDLNKNY